MVSAFQLSLFDSRGAEDEFAVRVSARARRLTARVHVDGRVEIVVPKGIAANAVRAFVQRNRAWIDQKVAEMGTAVRRAASMPATVAFEMTGETFAVDWRLGAAAGLAAAEGRLSVGAGSVAAGYAELRRWLMRAARERLAPRVEALAGQIGYRLSGVSIRRQRTRWGSCSSRGVVSLNCALLFMPPEVVRYLMIHELVHLEQMNHSARFWQRVEHHEPNYLELDRALTRGWRAVPSWVFKG